jgi:sugar transferase (PEP-CTERM system associated)
MRLNTSRDIILGGNMNYTNIDRTTYSDVAPARTGSWLVTRVLILGAGPLGRDLHRIIALKRIRTHKVVGFVEADLYCAEEKRADGVDIVGTYERLLDVVRQHDVQTVLVCTEDRRSMLPVRALLALKAEGIDIVDGHRFYEEQCGRLSIDSLRPSALVFSRGFRHGFVTKAIKRMLDVVIACAGLVLLSPLMLIVAILIKIDSPGPVFYRQLRVGLRGNSFMIAKFRSMRQDAEKNGPRWATENDPRVSRVGRILRKSRIDELPQLLNVLRSEMSLVGPRPERPVFVQELRDRIPYYDIRHTVKPGVTGWAQVRFRYGSSEADAHTKLQYDLYYVKNLSVLMDLRILIQTVRVVLLGEGSV